MQVSLNIQDDYYQQFLNFIKTLPSNAIKIVDDAKTEQYRKNKIYFQDALDEIESGKAELLSQDEYDKEMNDFMKTL